MECDGCMTVGEREMFEKEMNWAFHNEEKMSGRCEKDWRVIICERVSFL